MLKNVWFNEITKEERMAKQFARCAKVKKEYSLELTLSENNFNIEEEEKQLSFNIDI